MGSKIRRLQELKMLAGFVWAGALKRHWEYDYISMRLKIFLIRNFRFKGNAIDQVNIMGLSSKVSKNLKKRLHGKIKI